MKFKERSALKIIGLVLALSWPTVSVWAQQRVESVPYYRVFRGVIRADVSQSNFMQQLNTVFIPALPLTHAKNGAVAYLPAVPPLNKPASIIDEYALVGYESRAVYEAARQTPEGRQYGDLHWTIFDREKSKSGGAVILGDQIIAETPYDVIEKPVDWQSGYSTFFIGTRHPQLNPETFIQRLYKHVVDVRRAFSTYGLDGYVIVANGDYEAAFQHWPNKDAAAAAFGSDAGKAIIAEASGILTLLQFSEAAAFNGQLQPGEVTNVRFQRREPFRP